MGSSGEALTSDIQQHDWVYCKGSPTMIGVVLRVAKDGSWADVDWGQWSKRMQTSVLISTDTIVLPDGWTVTDTTRQRAKMLRHIADRQREAAERSGGDGQQR